VIRQEQAMSAMMAADVQAEGTEGTAMRLPDR
jgi:hypothetical protein